MICADMLFSFRFTRIPFALLLLSLLCLNVHASSSTSPTPKAKYTVRMVQESILMPDGVHLSATVYMPENAKAGEKFPALLEYLPYRKDDATAARDYPIHSYFAARGYVSARVDIRGFGSSGACPPIGNTPSRS